MIIALAYVRVRPREVWQIRICDKFWEMPNNSLTDSDMRCVADRKSSCLTLDLVKIRGRSGGTLKYSETLGQIGAMWMYAGPRSLKYVLGWLIAGMRGGATRAQIIGVLKESPQNANQLANQVGKDYRTIRHHLRVLEKNRIIVCTGDKYATTYFLSPEMEENYALFEGFLKKALARGEKK